MKRRYLSGVIAVVVVAVVVSGCGGALALLAGALAYSKAQDIVTNVKDLISGEDPTTYRVFIDGQEMGTAPNANGELNLTGVPVGAHLFSITSADKRAGWTQVRTIPSTGSVPSFSNINAITGSLIKGKVTQQTTSGAQVQVEGQLVIAVLNGDTLLRSSAIQCPPYQLTNAQAWLAGYTDSSGSFILGPAQYGRWLVFTATPGFLADAGVASVLAGSDATVNLALQRDATQTPGKVQGAVTALPATLSGAIVDAKLGAPYSMLLPTASHNNVVNAVGGGLIAEPWFIYNYFAVISGSAGRYSLTLPAGTQHIRAYKYSYKGKEGDVAITSGGSVDLDFDLR